MTEIFDAASFGTALRQLIDRLDSAVERAYRSAGLDFRPRYTPVIRALQARGELTIRALSLELGVSHSAVSQTVSQMAAKNLVVTKPGVDGRERLVTLGPVAGVVLRQLERQWRATSSATEALDEEVGGLIKTVNRANTALAHRSFDERLRDASASKS